jgi:aspartyl-tRNA(Asn)/glutamyl-tRNA(Gln) amidotransferase subunit C
VLIDDKVLENLEKLSMLKIDESKKEALKKELSEIVSYVENLNELDTSNLDSFFSTLSGGTPLREDIPLRNPEIPKDILAHAPRAEDDFFIVPKIIE